MSTSSKPAVASGPMTLSGGIDQIDCFPVPHLSAVIKGLEFRQNVFVRTRTRRALPATAAAPKPSGAAAKTKVSGSQSTPSTTTTTTTTAPATGSVLASGVVEDDSVVLYDVVRNVTTDKGEVDKSKVSTDTKAVDSKAVPTKPFATASAFSAADGTGSSGHRAVSFVRAGPRKTIVWKTGEVKAAIVTCGGLCPGLNDVVAELVNVLYFNYGVDVIYGVRNGYRGFYEKPKSATITTAAAPAVTAMEQSYWELLTPENVRDIHLVGGTILGSSRGGFDAGTETTIVNECLSRGVNQVYVIGGDGSHRGANKLAAEALGRGLKFTVCCVPKTVDNDVACIDKSFGFETAVAEAVKSIRSAAVEARCCPNGIGLVTLMGRTAGHIAANATLASREVDLCLVPEVPFSLATVLSYIYGVVQSQGHAVVVVAEGAGIHVLPPTGKSDASGNRQLPDIGRHLQHELEKYFTAQSVSGSSGSNTSSGGGGIGAAGTKLIDPSYLIRSVPCNAADSILCASLAHGAVHAAMHGFTAFSSGTINNRTALIPLAIIADHSPALLNPNGRLWERVLSTTQQPADLVLKSQL